MVMLPSGPLPPPGLAPPGLQIEPRYLETQLEPAYVVAESVGNAGNNCSEETTPLVAKKEVVVQSTLRRAFGHRLFQSADELGDSPAYVGDAFTADPLAELTKAAAAFEESLGPSLPQQDLWMIYHDLLNSQAQYQDDAKQQQYQDGWPQRQRKPKVRKPRWPQRQRKPKVRKPRQSCQVLIATQLNALNDEDPTKVIMLRKINRLGFDSSTVLKEHYQQYGVVSKVLVSNSHEKQPGQKHRIRPSGIGFVLFDQTSDAIKALAAGPLQVVAGREVIVSAFESREQRSSRSGSSDTLDGDTEGEQEPEETERRSSSASSDE